ncbi:LmbU family transcriptional regulator [Streptomyces puniciscabiei]|uniref:LmbU family transcriptional regulator n=1 Tax=Streptomyces puniciscabiei TaxID=164348 RepID=UPI003799D236
MTEREIAHAGTKCITSASRNSSNGVNRRRGLSRATLAKRTELTIRGIVPIDTWRELGEEIFRISESSTWWLGDWLLYGQDKYPERYKKAIAETALDYQTLRNYAWIARRFEPSRRREGLSFQHHVEVAALPADQQDLWLDRAQQLNWSRNELRACLRASRARKELGPASPLPIKIDVAPDKKAHWEHAADQANVSLSDWIESALDRAARAVAQS